MNLNIAPRITVKETAEARPFLFVENSGDSKLLISLDLGTDATIDEAQEVARMLNRNVARLSV